MHRAGPRKVRGLALAFGPQTKPAELTARVTLTHRRPAKSYSGAETLPAEAEAPRPSGLLVCLSTRQQQSPCHRSGCQPVSSSTFGAAVERRPRPRVADTSSTIPVALGRLHQHQTVTELVSDATLAIQFTDGDTRVGAPHLPASRSGASKASGRGPLPQFPRPCVVHQLADMCRGSVVGRH
jgi:hypothetical protein